MEVLITIIFYGIGILIAYLSWNEKFDNYIEKVATKRLPFFPNWLNQLLGLILFVLILLLVINNILLSFFIWGLISFLFPYLYKQIKRRKTFVFFQQVSFYITIFFFINFFFNVNHSRDTLGRALFQNYEVEYKSEIATNSYIGEEYKKDIAKIKTDNKIFNFFLNTLYPPLYRGFIYFLLILSLSISISISYKMNFKFHKISDELSHDIN